MGPPRKVKATLPTIASVLTAFVLMLVAVISLLYALLIFNPDSMQQAKHEHNYGLNPRPGPVASSSRTFLTSEEIRDRTGRYMALNLWVEVAHRTASEDPGNFHQTLFSKPDLDCVEQHRELLKTTSTPPIESFVGCGKNSAAKGRGGNWNGIGEQERGERARRSAGLLFESIDPPSLISVAMAHDRGMDITVRTNPEFARFAAEYDVCEEEASGHAAALVEAETPERMAKAWLRAEKELQACSGEVTAKLFE